MLEGASAPDFTLPDQNGDEVSLSGLKGETVVLCFYPRADTPRCQKGSRAQRVRMPAGSRDSKVSSVWK